MRREYGSLFTSSSSKNLGFDRATSCCHACGFVLRHLDLRLATILTAEIHSPAAPVHADRDAVLLEQAGKRPAGALALRKTRVLSRVPTATDVPRPI